jgi:outer membrane protein assembly factor BamA
MNRLHIHIISLIALSLFVSCTGTSHLAGDERLAKNGKVKIVQIDRTQELSNLRYELSKMATVNQNGKFLWMRPGLSLYNVVKEPNKDKGFKYWLKYKVGSPPVVYNQNQTERIKGTIQDYLFNNSYFNSTVQLQVNERKHERTAIFYVRTGSSYKVQEVDYKPSKKDLDAEVIQQMNEKGNIQKGSAYSLDKLIEERKRLAYSLMNNGYYYFRPDYFEYFADTALNISVVDLSLSIKSITPPEAFNQFRINKVVIQDYAEVDSGEPIDTHIVNNKFYLTKTNSINPSVVVNTIHLHSDSLYNRETHLRTLNQIRNLQVYKFVNITYRQDDSLQDHLNAYLWLVPLSKMSFSGELNANIKSNNFAGPGIIFSLTNRNTFRNAELLNISFGGRFESQVGQSRQGNTSYEIKTDASLQLPRLYPFRSRVVYRKNLPTTVISTGVALQERVTWYQMVNFSTNLRYNWRRSQKISHRVSLVDINLSNLINTTTQFDEYLQNNPSVARSFEEQFIVGSSYDLYYSASSDRLNTPFFLGFTFDYSGLFLGIINRTTSGTMSTPDNPYTILALPYAQYFRSILDIRKTFNLFPNHTVASRLIMSGGIPYGNSYVMPYIKQFYVGGTNSLRGFNARSVGPGSYKPEEEATFYDQAGDLKLEFNLEYRFPVWGILHSALFADIGNIWLVNEDESRPGGKFNTETFLDELAMSTGLGLRIKIDPIIIRFDWAWPLRYAYKTNGSNWVIEDMDFKSGVWRKENLILNISLGYPF